MKTVWTRSFKLAARLPTGQITETLLRALRYECGGEWTCKAPYREEEPDDYFVQYREILDIRGENCRAQGDYFQVYVICLVRRSTNPDEQKGVRKDYENLPVPQAEPFNGFDTETGHRLLTFHLYLQGYKPNTPGVRPEDFYTDMEYLEDVPVGNDSLATPTDVAKYVKSQIDKLYGRRSDDGEDDGGRGPVTPNLPSPPQGARPLKSPGVTRSRRTPTLMPAFASNRPPAGQTKMAAKNGIRDWVSRNTPRHPLPPTPGNVAAAKSFALRKWQERAREQRRDVPTDLSNGCKFASMFAYRVFGGQMRGNWHHQFVELPDGTRVDLTDAAGVPSEHSEHPGMSPKKVDPYKHDKRFWFNRDHRETLESCIPRVDKWVEEFLAQFGQGK
jgi:hypothetical protein